MVVFIGNIKIDSVLGNEKKGIVRGKSKRAIEVEVISEESPIDAYVSKFKLEPVVVHSFHRSTPFAFKLRYDH